MAWLFLRVLLGSLCLQREGSSFCPGAGRAPLTGGESLFQGEGLVGTARGPSCKLLPGAGQTLDHPSTCRPLDERPQDPQGPRIPESMGSTLTPTCHPHPVCQPILSARLWDVSASSCFFPPCQPPPGRADPPAALPRCHPHSPQQPEGSVDMQIGFSHSL